MVTEEVVLPEKWAVMFECREGYRWIDVTYTFHDTIQDAYAEAWAYAKTQKRNAQCSRVWVAPYDKRYDVSYKLKQAYNMF